MSGFPNLSNIQTEIANAILSKANSNYALSGLMPWFRLVTLNGPKGLIMDSLNSRENFSTRYGNNLHAGIVGYAAQDLSPVYAGISDEDASYVSREKRGLRPSPTIESFVVENGTEGLTRKAKFTIRTYTVSQADKVAAHFIEPGTYVLLEWGWNTPKSLSERAGNGGPVSICDMIQYTNLGVLKDKRASSVGTYDALLAVVTGGGLKYADGEAYDVDVELTSPGELPSYLRSQKGQILSKTAIEGGVKFTQGELDEMEDEESGDVGKFLFMQMYNELPLQKQIKPIKELIDKTDSRGYSWADAANFINIDTEVREDLVEQAKDVKLRSKDDATLKVPEDVPLVSVERYIRFELAYEIFRTKDDGAKILETGCGEYSMRDGSGKKVKTYRTQRIDINDTICRVHRYMFSTDKSKLYIPNTELPDFQLVDALKAEPLPSSSFDPLLNPEFLTINGHPKTDYNVEGSNAVDNSDLTKYAFPSTTEGPVIDYSWDTTIKPPKLEPYKHGFLKNLYVNFDFFLEVIQRPGLYEHEALMELLNGMSSAVNFHWDFQLVETGQSGTGMSCLRVIDSSFVGTTKEALEIDENGIPQVVKTQFYTQGIKSPFLNINLDIDIPGGLMNQIMAQKNGAASVDDDGPADSNLAGFSAPESKTVNLDTGLFSPFQDPVSGVLDALSQYADATQEQQNQWRDDAFKEQEGTTNTTRNWKSKISSAAKWTGKKLSSAGSAISSGAKYVWTGDTTEQAETRKKNFKYFIEKAGVFPKINDRNQDYDISNEKYDFYSGNNAKLEDILFVGTWNDPVLLKKYELFTLQKESGGGTSNSDSSENDGITNPPLTSIEFKFTIHGISGLKVGDIFRVVDLPAKFNDKIFQIKQINHQVSEQWITEVTAGLRNI